MYIIYREIEKYIDYREAAPAPICIDQSIDLF